MENKAVPASFNNKVIFRVVGRVKTRPRVLTIDNRSNTEELFSFVLRFVEMYPDSQLPLLGDAHTTGMIQDKARRTIESEHVYTDRDGEIHYFVPPTNAPWWMAIDEIRWTVQKIEQPTEPFQPMSA